MLSGSVEAITIFDVGANPPPRVSPLRKCLKIAFVTLVLFTVAGLPTIASHPSLNRGSATWHVVKSARMVESTSESRRTVGRDEFPDYSCEPSKTTVAYATPELAYRKLSAILSSHLLRSPPLA